MKKIIFNPFPKLFRKQLITFGILAGIIGCLLALAFNGRFDGVLDLHFIEKKHLFQQQQLIYKIKYLYSINTFISRWQISK